MIREAAPGGTYTSAPMLVHHPVYPVHCPTNAPERDVLRRSPPTGCVVGLGYHTSARCFTQRRCWLRLSQFSRPSCTTCTLAAPIFGIRQYVSPFAQSREKRVTKGIRPYAAQRKVSLSVSTWVRKWRPFFVAPYEGLRTAQGKEEENELQHHI